MGLGYGNQVKKRMDAAHHLIHPHNSLDNAPLLKRYLLEETMHGVAKSLWFRLIR
jgi:hypothetical protein